MKNAKTYNLHISKSNAKATNKSKDSILYFAGAMIIAFVGISILLDVLHII